MVRPATPGTVVVLAATIVLVLVSVSTPIVKSIYFLQADIGVTVANVRLNGAVRLGVFGYCLEGVGSKAICQGPQLGYELDIDQFTGGFSLPNSLIKWLTYALIIHPIAAGLGALSLILGIASHFREMSRSRTSVCFASIGTTIAMLAFVFDIILFSIAKSRINAASTSDVGIRATLGNGVWLTLAGFVLLSISSCFFGFGTCCMRRRPKQEEKDAMRPQMDQVQASQARRAATDMGNGSSGLPAFPEEERVPLTATGRAANKSVESLSDEHSGQQDIAGVGTGFGRGPGQIENGRRSTLPALPQDESPYHSPAGVPAAMVNRYQPSRQGSTGTHYASPVGARQQTPVGYYQHQPRQPSRQNSAGTVPSAQYHQAYVPNMYAVQRPSPSAFPSAQSGQDPNMPQQHSAVYPSNHRQEASGYPPAANHPMSAPPIPWNPPPLPVAANSSNAAYRHQSTPYMPHQQQPSADAYQGQAEEPYYPGEYEPQHQQQRSTLPYEPTPTPRLPPMDTGAGFGDLAAGAALGAAATGSRHRQTHSMQSETTHYAPQPHSSRRMPEPEQTMYGQHEEEHLGHQRRFSQHPAVHQQQQQQQTGSAGVLSPPMDMYDSYHVESDPPTAIPYLSPNNRGGTPSPSYHSGGDAYPSYGGNAYR